VIDEGSVWDGAVRVWCGCGAGGQVRWASEATPSGKKTQASRWLSCSSCRFGAPLLRYGCSGKGAPLLAGAHIQAQQRLAVGGLPDPAGDEADGNRAFPYVWDCGPSREFSPNQPEYCFLSLKTRLPSLGPSALAARQPTDRVHHALHLQAFDPPPMETQPIHP
jgi:hypothetical protein